MEARTDSLRKSKELEESLAARNAELAASALENEQLVERLRMAIDELSTPVLEVWNDVLALPVIGVVDTQRSIQMEERLLAAIMEHRSRFAIVDLTGVDMIDTSIAERFLKLARSVRLLGAECIITGIQPNVAQTLVTLGVQFEGVRTARSLKNGIEVCIARGGRAAARRGACEAGDWLSGEGLSGRPSLRACVRRREAACSRQRSVPGAGIGCALSGLRACIVRGGAPAGDRLSRRPRACRPRRG